MFLTSMVLTTTRTKRPDSVGAKNHKKKTHTLCNHWR